MNPQKNDEVAEYMRGLGFEYQKNVDRWVAPQNSPWKVYAMSTDQAAFFYQAHKAAVAEARVSECAKTNAWACTIPAKHALGENGQQAVYDYVDQRMAALRGKQ